MANYLRFFLVVCSLVVIQAAPIPDNTKTNCQIICNVSGAEAHFDEESKTCKCILVTTISDADMALVEKNARLLAFLSEPLDFESEINRKKRLVSKNHFNEIQDYPDQHEEILGQVANGNLPVISRNEAIRNLEKIRHRLRDLANHPTSRNAAARADAIRKSLASLSQRHIVFPTPEQRAHRAKLNHEKRTRDKQRMHRMNHLRTNGRLFKGRKTVVGAANNSSVTSDEEIEDENNHNSIITQPKDLFED